MTGTRTKLLISLLCLVPFTASATIQKTDILEFKGNYYEFGFYGETPLAKYFERHPEKKPKSFTAPSSCLWRGHIAHWKVHDGKLWLTAIESSDPINPTAPSRFVNDLLLSPFPLDQIFPEAGAGAVFASWYTGKIITGYGEALPHQPRQEFHFKKGVLIAFAEIPVTTFGTHRKAPDLEDHAYCGYSIKKYAEYLQILSLGPGAIFG